MIEIDCTLVDIYREHRELMDDNQIVLCIPTNKIVYLNRLVMGAGLALWAHTTFPGCDKYFAMNVNEMMFYPAKHSVSILSFPTKYRPHENSSIELISNSCRVLDTIIRCTPKDVQYYLPKVGCGLGRLNYEIQIKPILEHYFNKHKNVNICIGDKQ